MTIAEAIAKVDELKPNAFSRSDKVRWLAVLDGIIKAEIIEGYNLITALNEGTDTVIDVCYTDDTPANTVLLVPFPYDELYIYWLMAQIDFYNNEMSLYNNDISMYNSVYDGYKTYVTKTAKHTDRPMIYFKNEGSVNTDEIPDTAILNPFS